jgi:hypothetical protein
MFSYVVSGQGIPRPFSASEDAAESLRGRIARGAGNRLANIPNKAAMGGVVLMSVMRASGTGVFLRSSTTRPR